MQETRRGATHASSEALMEEGIRVTAMNGWEEAHGSSFVRVVFSNGQYHRLEVLLGGCELYLNVIDDQVKQLRA
jgi:hypothetical protein